jgi:hypothetical protein
MSKGLLNFEKWLENQNPNELPRETYNLQREWLDFDKLNRRAVKITHPGSGTADPTEVEHNEHDWSFSVVSPFNAIAWSS